MTKIDFKQLYMQFPPSINYVSQFKQFFQKIQYTLESLASLLATVFIHIHKSIEAGRDQSQSHFYIIMLPTQLHSAVKGTILQFMKLNYVNLIKWP